MIDAYLKFGATPAEYFLLGFHHLSDSERATFVTDMVKDKVSMSTINYDTYKAEIKDKYNFYLRNKAFFNREAWLVDASTECPMLADELAGHQRVFVKPLDGSYGGGAHILTVGRPGELSDKLQQLQAQGKWIIEELIIQSDEMSQWNPSSINTVRMPSFMVDGHSRVLAPFFRTGRKGAVIDNAGGGGIFAAVDASSGILITDGFCEDNSTNITHPDSGLTYQGWQIPKWEELLKITDLVHRNMPHHKYIAFDFALTPTGWVLIEGNWGQFIAQYATKKGIKHEFLSLMETE